MDGMHQLATMAEEVQLLLAYKRALLSKKAFLYVLIDFSSVVRRCRGAG